MNAEIIKLFKVSTETPNTLSFNEVNSIAIPRGYLFAPGACNQEALRFLESVELNPNATFYKEWSDIVLRDDCTIKLEQLIHYASTYGTDFESDSMFVVNDQDYSNVPAIKALTVIPCVTPEYIGKRCFDMLCSGIALKSYTMTILCDYIIETHYDMDVNDIKNREALVYLCDKLGVFPTEKFNLIRYLVYKTTGNTLLIKDRKTINAIKSYYTNRYHIRRDLLDLSKLSDKSIESLSSIFYRFKPLILAFKAYPANRPVINKIRRMAVKNHKPMEVPFWNKVLSSDFEFSKLYTELGNITNYKKLAIIREIDIRMKSNISKKLYPIRNGSMFVKDQENVFYNTDKLQMIRDILISDVVKSLSEKATTVKFNDAINLACPTSEKNFIGDIPYGSNVNMLDTNNVVGIYWRNDWGTRDFDLSYINISGDKIGWNSRYHNDENSILYSGDMTNAPEGASECLMCHNKFYDGIVRVNRYNGSDGSKMRFFFGQYDGKPYDRDYMLDPNDIIFSADITSDRKEKILGVVTDNVLTFMDFGSGDSIVSRNSVSNADIIEYYKSTFGCFVSLKEILLMAGFREPEDGEEAELDLANLSRDTLIELFS